MPRPRYMALAGTAPPDGSGQTAATCNARLMFHLESDCFHGSSIPCRMPEMEDKSGVPDLASALSSRLNPASHISYNERRKVECPFGGSVSHSDQCSLVTISAGTCRLTP